MKHISQLKNGGELVVGLNADIINTEGITRDPNTDFVMGFVLEGLVAFGEDLDIRPVLAESWKVSDEGRVYTFTLRDNLTFHNGAPVTGAEVKWSWDRLLNPDTGWRGAEYYNGKRGVTLKSVDVLDDRHIRYRLERPNALFLTYMADVQSLPIVLHPESLKPDGTWNSPIGTGPYKLKAWQPGEHILLERFENSRTGSRPCKGDSDNQIPCADRIKFTVIPEEPVRKASIVKGEVDVLPFFNVEHVKEVRSKGINVQVEGGLPWAALLVQTRDPLLSDVRFRKAIAHAIDLERIASLATHGQVGANPSAIPECSPFYSEAQRTWPEYSIEKARILLDGMGYNGEPVTIQTNKKYQGMYNNAVQIQSMLTAAGINAKLNVMEWAVQLDNYVRMNFQLSSFSYSGRLDPRLMYSILVGSKDQNLTCQWENPQAIAWVKEAKTVDDPTVLQGIYDNLHLAMAEDIPICGLYNVPTIFAVGRT